jgi:hypothetical protein
MSLKRHTAEQTLVRCARFRPKSQSFRLVFEQADGQLAIKEAFHIKQAVRPIFFL